MKKNLLAAAAIAAVAATAPAASNDRAYANVHDLRREPQLTEREADWRNGAVVYQVIVDRFAPPADLKAKAALYPAPKKLREWSEVPKKGTYVESAGVWSHEIDFWGGDLQSLRGKLDYIHQLGADVVYLNPIQQAYTNHKYDAQDYFKVSPEYGTRDDVKALAVDVHERGMRLMLDGVFNHMGRTSPYFKEAQKDKKSPYRNWFYFDEKYKFGYRSWVVVENLPELNLENPKLRARLWGDRDSVIRGYLRDGVDGWRLDVAFDIGFTWLSELTEGAHKAKPGSLVIGEVWNYPEEWTPALDGVMNMTARKMILDTISGSLPASLAGRHFERMVSDCGLAPMLKSWIILDNHDTVRLKHALPVEWQQRMAQVLQFTLPGSPCVYYGVEVGMDGGDDPEQRGPMRWDLANDSNPQYVWTKKLMQVRKENRALRIGDFRLLDTEKLLAFMRRTDRVDETVIVVANPSKEEITEVLMLRESKLMSYAPLLDQFSKAQFQIMAGTLTIKMPPETIYVLKTRTDRAAEYTPYKRVQ